MSNSSSSSPQQEDLDLITFVLQFYHLEIGTQRKTEQNLPKFSIELLKGERVPAIMDFKETPGLCSPPDERERWDLSWCLRC